MKKAYTFFFLFISTYLFSQSSWTNYATDSFIWDLELEHNYIWVGSQGGLIKVNTETGEKEVFQASNSGLHGTGIKEVEVAEDGTKWFGGINAGLFKFDNSNWQQFYYINTGDTLREIVNLKLDPNGNPWFFSNLNNHCWGCKKLISYDGNEFYNHNDNLPTYTQSGGFADFDFINSEELWVAFGNKIVRYNGTEVTQTYNSANSPLLQGENIVKIIVDNQGSLWVAATKFNGSGSYARRILKLEGTTWTVENESLPGSVYKLFKDNNGTLWFTFINENSSERSYASFDGTNWNYWSNSDSLGIPGNHTKPTLHLVDSLGNWWMTTYNGIREPKVYKVNGTSVTAYDTEISPLGISYFNDILADCDNNIWLVGDETLSKFDGENWVNYTKNQTGFVLSLWEAALDPTTCDIWFAIYSSNAGEPGIGRYNGSEFETFTLDHGGCLSIDVGPDGVVYAGTTSSGLAQYSNGNWTYFNEDNSPLNNYIKSVKVQSNGTVWVASYANGVARKVGDEWTVFDHSNSPVENNIWRIYEDSNENIWVRSDVGFAKFDGTDWELIPISSGDLKVYSITEDNNGNYWLGSPFGAVYWNGYDVTLFNILNSAIGANPIREIHVDPVSGDVWILNTTSVSVLRNFHADENISGIVFFDSNQNGVFDSDEDIRLSNQQVFLSPDSISAITNSYGGYSFYPEDIGNYQITYKPTPDYQPTSPTVLDTFFNRETITEMNFAAWTNNIPEQVSIDVVTGPLVCSNEVDIWVTFKNEGFLDISGEINLHFDPALLYFNSYPEASTIETEQVTWTFSDLGYMQSRVYRLTLTAPGTEALGQVFTFAAEITTSDNRREQASVSDELRCSYDPNDKTATPLGKSKFNYSLFTDPIQYTIRFQNKGNYLAKDILISDIIDPALDISTLKIISSSHKVTTTIKANRQVDFRFNDINLPPEEEDYLGSQGFIKYQIAALPGLPDPTIVQNTAAIYFDTNPAILTNTTESILVESLPRDPSEPVSPPSALVYPNPSSAGIWIEWQETSDDSNWEVEVYELSGKLLFHQKATASKKRIDISENGFYLLKIQKGDYLQVEKVIILGL